MAFFDRVILIYVNFKVKKYRGEYIVSVSY